MVSRKYLKEYAKNIYLKKQGYSFEKVLELFPMYYPVIYGYYQMYVNEERKKSATNIIMIGLNAVRMLDNADKYWNQTVEGFLTKLNSYTQGNVKDFGAFVKDFTDYALISIKYSTKLIKAYQQAKIYAEGIGATDYVKIADGLITDYTNYINKVVTTMKALSERINRAGGQNG